MKTDRKMLDNVGLTTSDYCARSVCWYGIISANSAPTPHPRTSEREGRLNGRGRLNGSGRYHSMSTAAQCFQNDRSSTG